MKHLIDMQRPFSALATGVAHYRQDQAVAHNRTPGNRLEATREQQLALNILGAHTELAARLFFWPDRRFIWHAMRPWGADIYSVPDLGPIIDVKGIDAPYKNLIVPATKVSPHWIYLLVLMQHPIYTIIGWKHGRDVLAVPARSLNSQNRPAHLIRQSELEDAALLFNHPLT